MLPKFRFIFIAAAVILLMAAFNVSATELEFKDFYQTSKPLKDMNGAEAAEMTMVLLIIFVVTAPIALFLRMVVWRDHYWEYNEWEDGTPKQKHYPKMSDQDKGILNAIDRAVDNGHLSPTEGMERIVEIERKYHVHSFVDSVGESGNEAREYFKKQYPELWQTNNHVHYKMHGRRLQDRCETSNADREWHAKNDSTLREIGFAFAIFIVIVVAMGMGA